MSTLLKLVSHGGPDGCNLEKRTAVALSLASVVVCCLISTVAAENLVVCLPADVANVENCRFHQLQDAVNEAKPGQTVILAPGIYRQGAFIDVPRLTVRGIAGAHLKGHTVGEKAALVVRSPDVTIEGIECSDIRVRDRNGACIRVEGDNLTVRNVYFHDNEQGILTGPGGGTLLVEHSRFERNGRDGRAHGLYINRNVDTFIFRNNEVFATRNQGHGVKSRAKTTIIEDNVIASLDGNDSRAIDIPNGGAIMIRRNVLQKGPNSENNQMIGLGQEGQLHVITKATIEDNLIIFDIDLPWIGRVFDDWFGIAARTGVVVASKSVAEIRIRRNVVVGARKDALQAYSVDNSLLRNRDAGDFPPYPAVSKSLLRLPAARN